MGDRYNEIFHFGPHHLHHLEALGTDLVLMPPAQTVDAVPPGALLVSVHGELLNGMTWDRAVRLEDPGREHLVSQGVGLRVVRDGDGWTSAAGPVYVEKVVEGVVLSGPGVAETLRDAVQPRLIVDE